VTEADKKKKSLPDSTNALAVDADFRPRDPL
jgi:hypothetical protein